MEKRARKTKELTTLQRLAVAERELAAARTNLKRADSKIERLLKSAAAAEKEHNRLTKLYHEVLTDAREKGKRVVDLEQKLESANKQLTWFRKQFFGQKTETEVPLDSDHDVDDEAESNPVEEPKRKRGQQRGSKGHGRTDRSKIEEEDPEIIDLDCANCPTCFKPYQAFPDTEDSSIVEYETRLYKRIIKRKRYAAQCNCTGLKVVTAPPPPKLYPKTSIGNSIWVRLVVQKMLHGTPTNRILKDFALKGLGLSAGTVTGGMQIINNLVDPLYEAIKLECQGDSIWNADETSWRIFEDRKRWWLWVIAGKRSVAYLLDQTRSGSVPDAFFEGSSGTLITDRFSAYKKLQKAIVNAWCWVHVRRDFLKVFQGTPKLRNWARQWLLDIAQLFVLNHQRFDLWSNGKTIGKSWHATNLELTEYVEQLQKNWSAQLRSAVHPQQKTILNSFKRHWPGLTVFLQDPRIPLDNNRAERLLRGCVIQRKNSYGNGAAWAGQLSAKLFSIIQTWLINGLDPEKMLAAYFDACSMTPGKPPPIIDNFLPWKMQKGELVQFALPPTYSRPA
jgi:transposase